MKTRLEIFERDNFTCQVCNKSLHDNCRPQLAHIIPQRKWIIKKYGDDIIHSEYNLLSVCSLKCNSKCDIGCNEMAIKKKVQYIEQKIQDNGNERR